MEKEIKEMLEEEIRAEIRGLTSFEQGSKEKAVAIENLAILYRLKIEEAKSERDHDEKLDANARDEVIKENQLTEQVKDRYFRMGLEVAGIVLPLIFYAAWMRKGFKFEETGTYTSTTFRGLFGRFKPTKK